MTRLTRPRITLLISAAALSATALILGANLMAAQASTAPGLGTAATYAILAGTTVTNTGNSVITGDLGISPGSSCTGLPAPCTGGGPGTVSGTIHAGDAQAAQAQTDLTAAYGAAASSTCNSDKTGQNLGGQTLIPGTYCQTTAPTLAGTLTLTGNGVFIFQIGSTLVTAPGATVALTNGAQPCNVFWKVSSSATLDTTTTFVGTVMALTSISLNNGASIAGRALARNGGVTLTNNRLTAPTTCNPVTVPSPTPTPTPTATPSPTATPPPTPTPTPTFPFAPGGGSFVIGDQNSAIGTSVEFWGAQWAKKNSLSGGPAPASFKGFAEFPQTPSCGMNWSADPGNSTPPPRGALPTYMAVIVTSSSTKSSATVSGDTPHIVVVKTSPGYAPNPGHAGTGTVVAIVC